MNAFIHTFLVVQFSLMGIILLLGLIEYAISKTFNFSILDYLLNKIKNLKMKIALKLMKGNN